MKQGVITETESSSSEYGDLQDLLAKTAQGDHEAFSQLYTAARGAVYAMALSVLKNSEDASDVTQETFVRVWTSAGMYRPTGSPMAWMLTIARNLALGKYRQRSRTAELTEAEWDAIPAQSDTATAEDRAVLQAAMAELSDTERQIVLLHAASGLKHREIASLLDMPLATVLSKYHRTIKKMRAKLEGDDVL